MTDRRLKSNYYYSVWFVLLSALFEVLMTLSYKIYFGFRSVNAFSFHFLSMSVLPAPYFDVNNLEADIKVTNLSLSPEV